MVADTNVAQDFGAGAHHHVIAQSGVAFAGFVAGATQGYALVEENVVADFGGLSNDDAHTVIDEEAAADRSARMDLDTCKEAADLGDDARRERNAPAVQLMRQPVREDGVKTGIAEKDLDDTFRGRILAKDSIDLFPNGSKHHALF